MFSLNVKNIKNLGSSQLSNHFFGFISLPPPENTIFNEPELALAMHRVEFCRAQRRAAKSTRQQHCQWQRLAVGLARLVSKSASAHDGVVKLTSGKSPAKIKRYIDPKIETLPFPGIGSLGARKFSNDTR